jgi:hypothetical protein
LRQPPDSPRGRGREALLLLLGLLAIYNLNGREVGTFDSQPAKFTARELAVTGTLRLDRVIAERPGLAERSAFARDRDGHWRSAYPILPALIAGGLATLLHRSGVVDLDAPLAPNLIAAVTASLLTASAMVLVFLASARLTSPGAAMLTAIGIGLGTSFWPLVSRTLWQHETVAFGLALALWAWLRSPAKIRLVQLVTGGVGLAMAGAARPQVSPLVLLMLIWLARRTDVRRAALPAGILLAAAGLIIGTNQVWFGSPFGALPRLEALHPAIHAVNGSVNPRPWVGAAGLLVSPNRGLLVFSPIVLVVLPGLIAIRTTPPGYGWWWLMAGACLQFLGYSAYSVWWGGHTFGPRYMLDVLIPLTPFAAFGMESTMKLAVGRLVGSLLLLWSIAVAGMGAFVYPNERWNTMPEDVDRHHERLWDLRDTQIRRVFQAERSPQNFDLFERGAIAKDP